MEIDERELIEFCNGVDKNVQTLCKEVNDKCEWMKAGVIICAILSFTAVFCAALALSRLPHN